MVSPWQSAHAAANSSFRHPARRSVAWLSAARLSSSPGSPSDSSNHCSNIQTIIVGERASSRLKTEIPLVYLRNRKGTSRSERVPPESWHVDRPPVRQCRRVRTDAGAVHTAAVRASIGDGLSTEHSADEAVDQEGMRATAPAGRNEPAQGLGQVVGVIGRTDADALHLVAPAPGSRTGLRVHGQRPVVVGRPLDPALGPRTPRTPRSSCDRSGRTPWYTWAIAALPRSVNSPTSAGKGLSKPPRRRSSVSPALPGPLSGGHFRCPSSARRRTEGVGQVVHGWIALPVQRKAVEVLHVSSAEERDRAEFSSPMKILHVAELPAEHRGLHHLIDQPGRLRRGDDQLELLQRGRHRYGARDMQTFLQTAQGESGMGL